MEEEKKEAPNESANPGTAAAVRGLPTSQWVTFKK